MKKLVTLILMIILANSLLAVPFHKAPRRDDVPDQLLFNGANLDNNAGLQGRLKSSINSDRTGEEIAFAFSVKEAITISQLKFYASYEYGSIINNENDLEFDVEISFYEDAGGMPGSPIKRWVVDPYGKSVLEENFAAEIVSAKETDYPGATEVVATLDDFVTLRGPMNPVHDNEEITYWASIKWKINNDTPARNGYLYYGDIDQPDLNQGTWKRSINNNTANAWERLTDLEAPGVDGDVLFELKGIKHYEAGEDLAVNSIPDSQLDWDIPLIQSITGLHGYAHQEMPVEMRLTDFSGISTEVGLIVSDVVGGAEGSEGDNTAFRIPKAVDFQFIGRDHREYIFRGVIGSRTDNDGFPTATTDNDVNLPNVNPEGIAGGDAIDHELATNGDIPRVSYSEIEFDLEDTRTKNFELIYADYYTDLSVFATNKDFIDDVDANYGRNILTGDGPHNTTDAPFVAGGEIAHYGNNSWNTTTNGAPGNGTEDSRFDEELYDLVATWEYDMLKLDGDAPFMWQANAEGGYEFTLTFEDDEDNINSDNLAVHRIHDCYSGHKKYYKYTRKYADGNFINKYFDDEGRPYVTGNIPESFTIHNADNDNNHDFEDEDYTNVIFNNANFPNSWAVLNEKLYSNKGAWFSSAYDMDSTAWVGNNNLAVNVHYSWAGKYFNAKDPNGTDVYENDGGVGQSDNNQSHLFFVGKNRDGLPNNDYLITPAFNLNENPNLDYVDNDPRLGGNPDLAFTGFSENDLDHANTDGGGVFSFWARSNNPEKLETLQVLMTKVPATEGGTSRPDTEDFEYTNSDGRAVLLDEITVPASWKEYHFNLKDYTKANGFGYDTEITKFTKEVHIALRSISDQQDTLFVDDIKMFPPDEEAPALVVANYVPSKDIDEDGIFDDGFAKFNNTDNEPTDYIPVVGKKIELRVDHDAYMELALHDEWGLKDVSAAYKYMDDSDQWFLNYLGEDYFDRIVSMNEVHPNNGEDNWSAWSTVWSSRTAKMVDGKFVPEGVESQSIRWAVEKDKYLWPEDQMIETWPEGAEDDDIQVTTSLRDWRGDRLLPTEGLVDFDVADEFDNHGSYDSYKIIWKGDVEGPSANLIRFDGLYNRDSIRVEPESDVDVSVWLYDINGINDDTAERVVLWDVTGDTHLPIDTLNAVDSRTYKADVDTDLYPSMGRTNVWHKYSGTIKGDGMVDLTLRKYSIVAYDKAASVYGAEFTKAPAGKPGNKFESDPVEVYWHYKDEFHPVIKDDMVGGRTAIYFNPEGAEATPNTGVRNVRFSAFVKDYTGFSDPANQIKVSYLFDDGGQHLQQDATLTFGAQVQVELDEVDANGFDSYYLTRVEGEIPFPADGFANDIHPEDDFYGTGSLWFTFTDDNGYDYVDPKTYPFGWIDMVTAENPEGKVVNEGIKVSNFMYYHDDVELITNNDVPSVEVQHAGLEDNVEVKFMMQDTWGDKYYSEVPYFDYNWRNFVLDTNKVSMTYTYDGVTDTVAVEVSKIAETTGREETQPGQKYCGKVTVPAHIADGLLTAQTSFDIFAPDMYVDGWNASYPMYVDSLNETTQETRNIDWYKYEVPELVKVERIKAFENDSLKFQVTISDYSPVHAEDLTGYYQITATGIHEEVELVPVTERRVKSRDNFRADAYEFVFEGTIPAQELTDGLVYFNVQDVFKLENDMTATTPIEWIKDDRENQYEMTIAIAEYADRVDPDTPIAITANITDEMNISKACLIYTATLDTVVTSDTLAMTQSGTDWTAEIPAQPQYTTATIKVVAKDDFRGYLDAQVEGTDPLTVALFAEYGNNMDSKDGDHEILWNVGDEYPEVVSVTGLNGAAGEDLKVTLTLSDGDTSTISVTATTHIAGVDEVIEMTQVNAKGEIAFEGTVPGQVAGTAGTIAFTLIDGDMPPVATDAYRIAWDDAQGPELMSVAGDVTTAQSEMTLNLTIADVTAIESVTGTYVYVTEEQDNPADTITGTITFAVPNLENKRNNLELFDFTGVIEASQKPASGHVALEMTDNYGNTTEASFPIKWIADETIYKEYDFEDGAQGWTVGTQMGEWMVGNKETLSSTYFSYEGNETQFVGINADALGSGVLVEGYTYSPVIDLEMAADDQVYFNLDYLFRDLAATSTFELAYRTSEDADWTVYATPANSPVFVNGAFPIPAEALTATTQFAVFYSDNGQWGYGAGIDNIKLVGGVKDYEDPVFVSLEGTVVEVNEEDPNSDNDMHLVLTLTDDSDVNVTGEYVIDGTATALEFTYVGTKNYYASASLNDKEGAREVVRVYNATIPEQAVGTEGTVNVVMTDVAGNHSEKDDLPFIFNPFLGDWCAINPTGNWDGALAFDGQKPFKAAVQFETAADKSWRFNRIVTVANDNLEIPWKVVEFDGTPTDLQFGTLTGTITTQAGANNDDYQEFGDDFTDDTSVNGQFALLLEVPAGAANYQGLVEGTDGTHSWIEVKSDGIPWSKLSDYNFKDWFLKARGYYDLGVEEELLPGRTELYQNYPNPFNPSTTIKFYNNMSGNVKLTVYNVKGEVVAKLVDGKMGAGYQAVKFDASSLNSGIYYYRLQAPTRTLTKKMVLVK